MGSSRINLKGLSEEDIELLKVFAERLRIKREKPAQAQLTTHQHERKIIATITKKMDKRVGLSSQERKIAIEAGLIQKDEEWFWTPEWQAKEKEADEAIEKDELVEFNSAEEAIKSLNGVKV